MHHPVHRQCFIGAVDIKGFCKIGIGPGDFSCHGHMPVVFFTPLNDGKAVRHLIGSGPITLGGHIGDAILLFILQKFTAGRCLIFFSDHHRVVGTRIFVIIVVKNGTVSRGPHIHGNRFSKGHIADTQTVIVIMLPAIGIMLQQKITPICPPQYGMSKGSYRRMIIIYCPGLIIRLRPRCHAGCLRQSLFPVEKCLRIISFFSLIQVLKNPEQFFTLHVAVCKLIQIQTAIGMAICGIV